jgi:hypothetical protein
MPFTTPAVEPTLVEVVTARVVAVVASTLVVGALVVVAAGPVVEP